MNAFADVRGGFFAETFERSDAAVLAGDFEFFDGFDAERVVQGFDFFGADAWNFQQQQEAGGNGGFEFVVVGKFSSGDELGDFFADAVADAGEVGEAGFGGGGSGEHTS